MPDGTVNEIRLRRDKPLCAAIGGKYITCSYKVKLSDIEYALSMASENSLYAVQNALINGYLNCGGGIRLGVCGEGVYEGEKLSAIKNVSSLTVRIPHEIKVLPLLLEQILPKFDNTLIVSPPACGKTTMLRETARRLSNQGERVLIIDERGEITATANGVANLDIGTNTDVILGVNKTVAYRNAVRSANPSVMVTDEIFGETELAAIQDCVRSGVKVLATMHGKSDIIKCVPLIADIFRYVAVLDDKPQVGTLAQWIEP